MGTDLPNKVSPWAFKNRSADSDVPDSMAALAARSTFTISGGIGAGSNIPNIYPASLTPCLISAVLTSNRESVVRISSSSALVYGLSNPRILRTISTKRSNRERSPTRMSASIACMSLFVSPHDNNSRVFNRALLRWEKMACSNSDSFLPALILALKCATTLFLRSFSALACREFGRYSMCTDVAACISSCRTVSYRVPGG